MYKPDYWVVVRIVNQAGTFYKVLGGWAGSYTRDSNWRINSGITRYVETREAHIFIGYSGSEYMCRKEGYGLIAITADIVAELQNILGNENFQVMPEATNWNAINWND